SYDCGSLANSEFPTQSQVPGTRYMTLDELMDLVAASPEAAAHGTGLHLEIKVNGQKNLPSPGKMAEKLMERVAAHGFLDRVIIQSFDPRYTHAARRLQRRLGARNVRNVVSPSQDWIKGWAGRLLFHGLEDLKMEVIPWTANTPEDWQYLIDLGVQGIVTDDPAGLIRYLEERGLR
ncbi:MAG TPA: glycerophosphodiester phosphodiesterase family protein, partial [Bdellovibrionota bacterium]|nr:glycerophosphodiester phosphodiesterase family protein [Bdellovibrionota bacterium]